jgi:phage terminase large subunit-like protein
MAAKRDEIGRVDPTITSVSVDDAPRSSIIGRRQPSYVLIPKHTSSKGAEAAELMRSAGVTLDGWQTDVLAGALGVYKGHWAARIVTLLTGRQNGKSECGIAAALHLAVSAPKKLAIIAAHETKTGDELFIRCRDIVETSAFESYAPKVYSANGQQGIRFNNGSRIRFVARSKHQVRGFSVDLLLIDEAMILTDIAWSSPCPR